MKSTSPAPKGLLLGLILTGVTVALATSVAALVTGHTWLMGIAAGGFALQAAGWMVHGHRNGGAA